MDGARAGDFATAELHHLRGCDLFRTIERQSIGLSRVAICVVIATSSFPAAADPVALVEAVRADRKDIQFLDYLDAGTVLELADSEILGLAYFSSCRNETITGGTVIVGEHQSEISGGTVEASYVDCDGATVALGASQSQETATVVFRKPPDGEMPAPDRVIYDPSPLIKTASPGIVVVIRRLDVSAPDQSVSVDAGVVDLRDRNLALDIGGLYEFASASKRLIIKVSTLAQAGSPTAVSRLIVF